MNADAGLFVTIEGGEGAGKSTAVTALRAALEQAGREVVVTREPGGAPGAEQIRALLVAGEATRWGTISELCLFLAARRDHLDRTILPALARGAVVLCDRFHDSTVAYQGHGRGLPLETIARISEPVLAGATPDLTLLLDLDPRVGLARRRGEATDAARFEGFDLAFHQRVRDGFLSLAAAEPRRFRVIDASASAEQVAAACVAGVRDAWDL